MSLRASLKNLILRSPTDSLRERAADLRASLPAPKPQVEPSAPEVTHADRATQAGLTGDVLASSGIDHRDGTVSYADATGKVWRRPMAQWVGFNAMQMHSHIQGEIGRRRVLEANHLPGDEHEAWEARIRRELRSDAVFDLAFRSERAFKAAQDLRSGAEPLSAEVRAASDGDLIALAPEWEAARDLFARLTQEQIAVEIAADALNPPGDAPKGSGPEWQAWFQRCQDWRKRTGIEDAEEASGDALEALGRIEDRIAELSAASLAGLRLKALVAQRCDDIGVIWPQGLGDGLARDLLAFNEPAAVDWYDPPLGFMASPALEPTNFAQVPQGLQIELHRLRGIAWAEYHRRVAGLREGMSEDEARVWKAKIHAELFLPALTAAVDTGSVEAQALTALHRPTGPDPVFALIEEHRAAFAEWDRLSNIWNEMTSDAPGYAEAMAVSDKPGKREVAAYNALFAAQPATLQGVAALAEYLHEATERTSPDIEPSDGERGLSTVADALRAVMATREERSRRETSLVGMLDLSSATLDDLQALHNLADLVGGVAYAVCWQSRARGNVAGELMQWIGDALTDVETSANNEARRRSPASSGDRETRLEMLALPVIQNGDPDEIAALAGELVAHAVADLAGR